jgi:HlyD family secretion protein
MKLWNDDQQAQTAWYASQVATARQRVNEACTVAANAEREAERQAACAPKVLSRQPRRTARAARHWPGAPAARPPRPTSLQAEARVRLTRVEQGRTVLYAPFAGTIAKIVGEVGEYSTPSPPGVPTPPAIDLIDDSCLYVKAPMDEVDAPRIAPGSRCASASTRCPAILPGQGQARRAVRLGGREAGAHRRYRGHFDDPTRRASCWSATARTSK